jgi:Fe-S-cluster containining protein
LPVLEAVAEAVAVAEEGTVRARAQNAPPSACQRGCAWCCYKAVGTSAAEVIQIARYLRETLSEQDVAAILGRAAEQRQRGAGARTCPLLVDNQCSAYSVRPLTCRGFNSADAKRCERAHRTGDWSAVPVFAPQQRLATFALDGLRAALQGAGLSGELLDLAAALEIALGDDGAEARWLAGEHVFAKARMP